MSYRLIIYDEARNDIDRNADWWSDHHSSAQAEEWVVAIYSQIRSLSELPNRCPLAIENSKFPYDIQQLLVGKSPHKRYRTIFTVIDDAVHVLAVLDGAQDKVHPSDLPTPRPQGNS